MPTIPVRDTTIHFERVGDGDPALVLVHGMCGGAFVWEDQMARLSDRFTCVAYDRRGHGRSPIGAGDPVEDQSDESHADDAAALIEALDLDRPVVVSSSGGAVVTVELLHRHPDLLAGAVVSEPPLFSIDPAAGQSLLAEVRPAVEQAVEAGGPPAAVDAFFEVVCPGLWSQLDDTRRARYRQNAPMLFANFEARSSAVTLADLGAIRTPVLVLAGTTSHPSFQSTTRLLARSLPDARFVEVAGSGHVTYAEKPAEFANGVAAFAEEIAAAPAGR